MNNAEQITTGKNRLRQKVKELEQELEAARNAPVVQEVRALRARVEEIEARLVAVQEAAGGIVRHAADLVRALGAEGDPPKRGAGLGTEGT